MRAENHVATSDAQYSFEEVQLLKEIDEHKRQLSKNYLTNIELYRWLKEKGRIRQTNPVDLPIIRRQKPLRRLEDEIR